MWKRFVIIVGCTAAIVAVLAAAFARRAVYVDLWSAKERVVLQLGPLELWHRIRQTDAAVFLQGQQASKPDWRLESSYGLWGKKHSALFSAISQANIVARQWQDYDLDAGQAENAVRRILHSAASGNLPVVEIDQESEPQITIRDSVTGATLWP